MRLRASALGGLFVVAAVLVPPVGAGAAGSVVGHPRCTLDDVAADYTWWADGQRVAVTEEPQLEWEGMLIDANEVDSAARALVRAGAEYYSVFRFAGATAFCAYGLAVWQRTIWFHQKASTSLKTTFDSLIYALVTAGAFAGFWPG